MRGHSPEDDEFILQQAEMGTNWADIAKALGRPAKQPDIVVKSRYNLLQRGKIARRHWTAAEDAKLKALIVKQGKKWSTIGKALGRHSTSCQTRWIRLTELYDEA
ncbi:hypothetical protein JCM11251_001290 [Rhodosporidiobolus azoricus]